ncbi:MAG: hypothetical protein ACPGJS_03905 [Flammeovirgaceae bacterium]
MEPVIMIIAVTAIISGAIIKSKKINLEKERMRLGMGIPPEPKRKKGLFSRAKSSIPPLIIKNNTPNEMDKIQKRLENLEVIMLDQAENVGSSTQNESLILEEIRNLSARLRKLEEKQG